MLFCHTLTKEHSVNVIRDISPMTPIHRQNPTERDEEGCCVSDIKLKEVGGKTEEDAFGTRPTRLFECMCLAWVSIKDSVKQRHFHHQRILLPRLFT
jgi:hypothetical protein